MLACLTNTSELLVSTSCAFKFFLLYFLLVFFRWVPVFIREMEERFSVASFPWIPRAYLNNKYTLYFKWREIMYFWGICKDSIAVYKNLKDFLIMMDVFKENNPLNNLFWWQLQLGSRNGNATYRSVNELFSMFSSGHSADHIVTCLTRDSYNTHTFIQQLMAVLSLLARTPSPEPVDKDFYSEFGSKNTGEWSFLHVITYLDIILKASPKLYSLLRDIYASVISYLIL